MTAKAIPALPTIADLGRHLTAVEEAYYRADEAINDATTPAEELAREAAMTLFEEHRGALQDLIATMPACSIADAIYQLWVAIDLADGLAGFELTADEAQRRGGILKRILVSIMNPVAAAGGVETTGAFWEMPVEHRQRQFACWEDVR